ncbi:MAG: hypothetical protein ACFFFH_07960 [Candidatus Thorarchaeota archaeon]
MSRERRKIGQRKIRRIKRTTDESSFQLDLEPSDVRTTGLAPNTKMYYTKIAFGVSTGTLTGFLLVFSDIFLDWWILILIIALVVCVIFVRYVLKITEDQVDLKRLWLSGTFTFLVLFIVMTALVWMFLK